MRIIVIDGKKMTDESAAHSEFRTKLGFPNYYGENVHALIDCLSDLIGEDLHIVWHDYRAAYDAIPEHAISFVDAFYFALQRYPTARLYKITILDGPLDDLRDIIP